LPLRTGCRVTSYGLHLYAIAGIKLSRDLETYLLLLSRRCAQDALFLPGGSLSIVGDCL
jgi:predicted lipid carrier protein YhbT